MGEIRKSLLGSSVLPRGGLRGPDGNPLELMPMEPDEAPLGTLGVMGGYKSESDRGEEGLEFGGREVNYCDVLVA